jgi:hypothetical protein
MGSWSSQVGKPIGQQPLKSQSFANERRAMAEKAVDMIAQTGCVVKPESMRQLLQGFSGSCLESRYAPQALTKVEPLGRG